MHLYWRIQQDLSCLGEIIMFHDPGLIRSIREWARKNRAALVMAEGFYEEESLRPNLN